MTLLGDSGLNESDSKLSWRLDTSGRGGREGQLTQHAVGTMEECGLMKVTEEEEEEAGHSRTQIQMESGFMVLTPCLFLRVQSLPSSCLNTAPGVPAVVQFISS